MGFAIDTRGLIETARKLRAAKRAEQVGAREAIELAALISDRDLKEVALNAGRPQRRGLFMESRPGFRLGTRSGITAASVTTLITKKGNEIQASVGTPLKHVLANEKGATITPKTGRAIVIPTVHALTASGALNNLFAGLATLRNAMTKSGRRLFVFRSRKGSAWLAGQEGAGAGTVVRDVKTGRMKRGGRLTLYFLLVTRAEIPARYMFRNAKRRVEPVIEEAVGRVLGVKVVEAMRTAR